MNEGGNEKKIKYAGTKVEVHIFRIVYKNASHSNKKKCNKQRRRRKYEAKKSCKLWMRDHNVLFGIDEREGDGSGLTLDAHKHTHTRTHEPR